MFKEESQLGLYIGENGNVTGVGSLCKKAPLLSFMLSIES